MTISRGWNCLKLLKNSHVLQSPLISRSCGRWAYRSNNIPTENQNRFAEGIGALIWGWIIYQTINNYELITGEYTTPDPSKWTDEELGIPPDSEGL